MIEKLKSLGQKLSTRELKLVEHRPAGEACNCHHNVFLKVALEGGTQVFGWKFQRDETATVVAAISHSVWRSPAGELLDITPNLRTVEGEDGKVYFLPSDYQERPGGDHFFPLSGDAAAKRLARRYEKMVGGYRRSGY